MASEPEREPTPIEPLLDAVNESVLEGYKALEHVLEGLAQSLRLTTGGIRPGGTAVNRPGMRAKTRPPRLHARHGATRPSARPAPGPGAPGAPVAAIQELTAIVAQLVDTAGAVAEQVACTIAEQLAGGAVDGCLPVLCASVAPGGTAPLKFTVWNAGSVAIKEVVVRATDLVAAHASVAAGTVTFKPETIAVIAPGRGETIDIEVAVPKDTAPGLYSGVVIAWPGDACAVLELTVTSPRTDRPVAPEEPQKADSAPADAAPAEQPGESDAAPPESAA
jgi:hypothetical protein